MSKWVDSLPLISMRVEIRIQEFYGELIALLGAMLEMRIFYLPEWSNLRVAMKMTLVASRKVSYTHKGMTLPAIFGRLGQGVLTTNIDLTDFNFMVL